MLALVFAKLCHKFMIAHALLSVFDLLIAHHSETLGQPGPWEFQISNLPFFLFKIHGLYSLGVLQLRLQTTRLFLPPRSDASHAPPSRLAIRGLFRAHEHTPVYTQNQSPSVFARPHFQRLFFGSRGFHHENVFVRESERPVLHRIPSATNVFVHREAYLDRMLSSVWPPRLAPPASRRHDSGASRSGA